MPSYTKELEDSLNRAGLIAERFESQWISTEHLLLALLSDPHAVAAIRETGDDALRRIEQKLEDYFEQHRMMSAPEEEDLWARQPRHRLSLDPPRIGKPVKEILDRAATSGEEVISGVSVLLGLVRSHSQAASVLASVKIKDQDIAKFLDVGTADTVEQTLRKIQESSISASVFVVYEERLHFEQRPADKELDQRKELVEERYSILRDLCDRRENEHLDFAMVVKRYGKALEKVTPREGGYELFLTGFEIETSLEINKRAPPDPDRNPPLGTDQIRAAQLLLIAHAGLVALFPDMQMFATELDQYRQMSESLDALRNRVLDPTFQHLSQAANVFDRETLGIAQLVEQADLRGTATTTLGLTSVKHSWIRGALAAIGQYVLKQTLETGKIVRDTVVKEGVRQAMHHPDALAAAMIAFLAEAKPILVALANALHAQFGWITSLLSHVL